MILLSSGSFMISVYSLDLVSNFSRNCIRNVAEDISMRESSAMMEVPTYYVMHRSCVGVLCVVSKFA